MPPKSAWKLFYTLEPDPNFPLTGQQMFATGFKKWYSAQAKTHRGRQVEKMVLEILTSTIDYLQSVENDSKEINLLAQIEDPTNHIENDILRALSACLIAGYKKQDDYLGSTIVYTPKYIKDTRLVCENLGFSIQSTGEATGREGDAMELEDQDADAADPDVPKVVSAVDALVKAAVMGDFGKDGKKIKK